MTELVLRLHTKHYSHLLWGIIALAATLVITWFGITLNQALALIISALVLTIWAFNKPNGLIAAILFFFIKPLFVRIAYAIDFNISSTGGFDLLGITPALLLAGIIVWHLFQRISSGDKIIIGRTRLLMVLFSAVAFVSIFNPANSILVGLGGFERNVLPNMMILLLASFVFVNEESITRLLKTLFVFGILSCLYGIGQYAQGVYPWEKDWILNVAFSETSEGWLTIGLRGVEFRLYSLFYSYMDFTFCNAIIFALAVAYRSSLSNKWKKITGWYIFLWFLVLLVSLERMPLVMSLVAIAVVYFIKSDTAKRKRILFKTALLSIMFVTAISVASPFLKNTGTWKLIRLAELANPLAASSIHDRMERKWGPTMNTIAGNPLGVGIGYGSQTRANTIAAQTDFWVEPHNELLQKTLETGIVGGFIFFLLLISVFRDGLNLSHSREEIRKLGIGFAAATIGFWLCGLVNVPFSGSSGLLYWTLAGIVLATSERTKNPEQTADISKS